MLHYIYANDLHHYPVLRDSMFRDRADQFGRRLRWDVTVDARGWEIDEYDTLNPLYIIWADAAGRHGGSARFLPTVGRTMVNDHFLRLTGGVAFRSPYIWECTRFCLAPGADHRTASALMAGGGEVMRAFSVDHFVGVFDHVMLRVYRGIGAVPDVLGTDTALGRGGLSVGLWTYDPGTRDRLFARAGLTAEMSDFWFAQSFDAPQPRRMTA